MPNPTNFITEDTTIRGSITTASSLTVAGAVEGDINAGGEVSVLEEALVKGDISGPSVSIAGKVEGRISASGRLVIGAAGEVRGDISVRSLLIEEGGTLEGQCSMGGKADVPRPAESVSHLKAPPLRPPSEN
ncbi:MAG: polymer-forming cytoskeletal protein [Myxococcota bacterium]